MRVLHFASYSVGSFVYQSLFEGLSEQGVEQQSVFVPISKGTSYIAPEISNVEYAVASIKGVFAKLSFKHKSALFCNASYQFFSGGYDLIHAHTLFSDGWAAYLRSVKESVPLIVTVRNSDINYFYKYLIYTRGRADRVLDHAEKIIFLSEGSKNEFLSRALAGLRERWHGKIEVVPNGIDDFWFTNNGAELVELPFEASWDNTVLFVGNSSKNKNLNTVLSVVEGLRSSCSIGLLVVGVSGHNSDTIKYLGKVNDKRILRACYRVSDVLLVPSFFESFGLVYAEAYSQGTPVIASLNQGFDGWVDDGVTGYLVCPTDKVQIASCVLGSLKLKSSNGDEITRKALCFKKQGVALKMLGLYREAVS